jgi:hypothetical protein
MKMEDMKRVKAFKVFNSDWTCRDFKYEVGKEYFQNGTIKLCENGFHACINLVDCFNYYSFNSENKVAEVELFGTFDETKENNKICASNIKIIKELSWEFVLKNCNSGNYNSGNRNSGHRNSGNYNSGNYNSGNRNSGHRNSGHRNSGNYNFGDYNSGDYNSGNYNSGDYNSGNCNSGDFNTKTFYFLFNKPIRNKNYIKPNFFFNVILNIWVGEQEMSNEEKINNPNFYINLGYLKTIEYKDAWLNAWNKAKMKDDFKEEYNKLVNIPNFDKEIFKEITGIDIDKD